MKARRMGKSNQGSHTFFLKGKPKIILLHPQIWRPDYHLFLHLKKHLGGQRLQDDDEVKTVVAVVNKSGGRLLWEGIRNGTTV
ncbi:hypothetical protein JTE90_006423 [Oedothorax gibbosus]|uniref:Uncharacterized protein n=1 Tax=Oedothorax gibbosus TaxID=931172 RepID=A0AAV6TCX1_9ARAC|nr:hypothetical protein JTE90_006423 [Oedothorax gibbosus]